MQTHLADVFLNSRDGREADAILRSCVHCGFCTATCPTYQLLGDELDGPRGRIYLIKEVLEGTPPTHKTQLHLDRCLTCRACETTCPSGVRYGRLLDIGRQQVEILVPRLWRQRAVRSLLLFVLSWRSRFAALLSLARWLRPVMPASLKRMVPPLRPAGTWPAPRHARRMLVLEGCVQPSAAPSINAAAARLLDRIGVSLIRVNDGCCGAMAHHLSAESQALAQMRRNVDAWWPEITAGVEALIVTASGCGTHIREYGVLLSDDPQYAARAARVSELFRDLSQIVAQEVEKLSLESLTPIEDHAFPRLAFQSPCSLQHGLQIRGVVEALLNRAGFKLMPVADSHLCCGSAGTYSLLQPTLSRQLKANKIAALEVELADAIVTANIGCLMQLASAAKRPVFHWIELLEDRLAGVLAPATTHKATTGSPCAATTR